MHAGDCLQSPPIIYQTPRKSSPTMTMQQPTPLIIHKAPPLRSPPPPKQSTEPDTVIVTPTTQESPARELGTENAKAIQAGARIKTHSLKSRTYNAQVGIVIKNVKGRVRTAFDNKELRAKSISLGNVIQLTPPDASEEGAPQKSLRVSRTTFRVADSYIKPGQLLAHVIRADCMKENLELTRIKKTLKMIMRCPNLSICDGKSKSRRRSSRQNFLRQK